MKRIVAPLLVVMLLLGVAAVANADTAKYICDPINFPDGTSGVAVVKVIMSSGDEAAAPTVMVTVDYYSPGFGEHLGRYEDWSSSSDFPKDEYEAQDFAYDHYNDRW